jgi:excisionase family DNA binding protein
MCSGTSGTKEEHVSTDWYSPEELADMLGVPVATVYQWRYKGIGPRGHRLGKHVRYSADDVAAWLEKRADSPAGRT